MTKIILPTFRLGRQMCFSGPPETLFFLTFLLIYFEWLYRKIESVVDDDHYSVEPQEPYHINFYYNRVSVGERICEKVARVPNRNTFGVPNRNMQFYTISLLFSMAFFEI